VSENHAMLKKTTYTENGSAGVVSGKKSTATPIKPGVIASENEEISSLRPKNVSVFGASLVFKGELSANEEIIIEGIVEGTIAHHKKTVTVGKQGRVNALIHARSVKIHGRVDGDIHGDEIVIMTDGAEVNGNIYCPRIMMEAGALFNGTIQMS